MGDARLEELLTRSRATAVSHPATIAGRRCASYLPIERALEAGAVLCDGRYAMSQFASPAFRCATIGRCERGPPRSGEIFSKHRGSRLEIRLVRGARHVVRLLHPASRVGWARSLAHSRGPSGRPDLSRSAISDVRMGLRSRVRQHLAEQPVRSVRTTGELPAHVDRRIGDRPRPG